MMLDVGPVAACRMPPVLDPCRGAVAAVHDGADQRLGDVQHAAGPAGEVDVVVDVGAGEPAELGRSERPQPVPGTGVDIDFGRLGQRDPVAVRQDQRGRDIAPAVTAGDQLLQRLFHDEMVARTLPGDRKVNSNSVAAGPTARRKGLF